MEFDVFGGFQIGILSAVPYVCAALVIFTLGFLVDDILRKRRILSTTAARKVISFIGKFVLITKLMYKHKISGKKIGISNSNIEDLKFENL